ncbi:MAG: sugar phosphate isomerase/epimerase [Chloroflexi bacterium]|nr:sugar phosphate isomerase/epimerase [Chloroflexota bacterium]MDA1297168.1 sugar phosphate isomerase/epimerase [Chloroflexota bacterium]
MIKLSLQSLSYRDTFKDGKIDLAGIIEKAAEYRMDGVDLHFTHFASTEPAYLEELRMLTLRRGLHICYIGVSNNFGKTGDELREQVELMKRWIDVAQRMGVQMVRAFGSWVPEGESAEDAWPRLVASTKEVAEYGQSKGVVVGLHNHNHGCIPATGEQVVRLLRDVGNPYYSHILDTGQYIGGPGVSQGERGSKEREDELYDSIAKSAPHAVHVRGKVYRIASGTEAWLDYDRILPIIKGVGFNGWMSVVFEGQDEMPEPDAVPLAVEFFRKKLAEYGM